MTELPTRGARLGVVVSTYNWPEALAAVLRSFADQSDQDFTLVVADDGSAPTTRAVVEHGQEILGERLLHVWQPDEGFRLARVLNLGVSAIDADYVVILHGESVPRRDFVRVVRSCMHPGWYVAGRRVQLSQRLTNEVLGNKLPMHRWGLVDWFRVRTEAGPLSSLTRRDRRKVGARGLPEFIPVNRTYGYLLGVWRSDFERVNGYDMRFEGWGEEDVDIALRLGRTGLRCGHAGPNGTLIHLWHETVIPVDGPNWYLLQETEHSDRIEAVEGIRELANVPTRSGVP